MQNKLLTFKEFILNEMIVAPKSNHDVNASHRFFPELAKARKEKTRKENKYKKLRKVRGYKKIVNK